MLDGWPGAGTQVRKARARLGYRTTAEFARATGLSYRTINDLETGRRDTFTDETLQVVEGELGWYDGEIRDRAAGKRIRRTHPDDLQRVIDAWRRLSPRDKQLILQIVGGVST